MTGRPWAGGVLLLLLSLGSAARAEAPSAAGPPPLETVEVPFTEEDSTPESPSRRDPTADVSVIQVAGSNAQVDPASELLLQAPGVVMHDVGGVGQAQEISVRGASASGVAVFLDGIPLNGPGGVADVSLVPTAALERVEVLRGAGSLFGSGSLGGVVNLVTRAPRSGLHLFGEATYGSFGSELAQAGASGSLLGGAGLVLVNALHSDGDFPYVSDPYALVHGPKSIRTRTHNESAQGEALTRFERSVGSWKLSALLEAAALARGLAGTVDNPTDDFQHTRRLVAGVRASRDFASGASVGLRAFARAQADSFEGQDLGGRAHQMETLGGAEAQGSWLVGTHGLSASLLGMGDSLREDTHANPSWGVFSAVAQDQLLLLGDALTVAPSARFDRVGPFTGLSPKLGVSAELPRGFSLRANGGSIFRAPSFLELYVAQGQLLANPGLRPERSLSADAQVRHRTSRTSVALTGFYRITSDLIAYEYYGFYRAKPQNFSTASVQGLEAEASYQPWRYLRASGNYTLLYSRDLLDEKIFYGNELPNRPRHTAFAELSGGLPWLTAHVRVLAQSEQFLNRGNKLTLPARAFVHAGVASELPGVSGLQVAFEVKNVLDAHSADFDGYPLPGRAYYVTLRVALDRPGSAPAQTLEVEKERT